MSSAERAERASSVHVDDRVAIAGRQWCIEFAHTTREDANAIAVILGWTREPLESETTRDHRLTRREHEIVRLLAARRTNAEIAAELGISGHTARNHVQRILDKLGLRSRRDVGRAALHESDPP